MKMKNKWLIVLPLLFCISCTKKSQTNILINQINTKEISLINKNLIIEKGGTYNLKGEIKNGTLIINTDEEVKLILNNLKIQSQNNAAIVSLKDNNLTLELFKDSQNILIDNYTREKKNKNYQATIYTKGQINFIGEGNLKVIGNYHNAIESENDINMIDGYYEIFSKQDGIVTSKDFIIKNSSLIITTTNFDKELPINYLFGGYDKEQSGSKKGLKASGNILLEKITASISTVDDAINCHKQLTILNSNINVKTYDDAFHADELIVIDKGKYQIENSYEGIESLDIIIENGDFNINSIDDAININTKYDNIDFSNINEEEFNFGKLIINDGNFTITTTGDGIDSNGEIILNKGNFNINCAYAPLESKTKMTIDNIKLIAFSKEPIETFNRYQSNTNIIMLNFQKIDNDLNIKINGNNTNLEYSVPEYSQGILIIDDEYKQENNYTIFKNDKKITNFKIKEVLTTLTLN